MPPRFRFYVARPITVLCALFARWPLIIGVKSPMPAGARYVDTGLVIGGFGAPVVFGIAFGNLFFTGVCRLLALRRSFMLFWHLLASYSRPLPYVVCRW